MERSERTALYAFLSGVGVAMLSAAGPIAFPDAPRLLWQLIFCVGALIAVIPALFLIYEYRFIVHAKRAIPLIGMIISGLVFLGCAGWYFWPISKNVETKAEPAEHSKLNQAILAQCYWSQPPATVPAYGLYWFQLLGRPYDGGISSTSQQPGSPTNFPNEFTYFVACKINNYSDKLITTVELNLHLDYKAEVKNETGTGTTGGDIVLSLDLPSPPIYLGVGDRNEFIFYLTNRSTNHSIDIKVPKSAMVRVAGSDKLESVELIPPDFIHKFPFLPPYVATTTNPPVATPLPQAPPMSPTEK